MTRIRVALADDHPIVRAGIKALIVAAPEMELVGEAADGFAALDIIRAMSPEVVVADVSMPGMSGFELIRRCAEEGLKVRFLLLTVHEDRAYVQQMLKSEGSGYLLKRSSADELVRAIRAVFSGGIYLDPAIAGKLLAAPTTAAGRAQSEALSDREEEVLLLIARWFSNKEVAVRLHLSIKTVETYKARATEKLGLRTRAQIVRYAAASGWLDDSGVSLPR